MDGPPDAAPDSPEVFLLWAEGREEKHEFVDGVVVMQAGASRDHERVAKRIFVSLLRQVDEAVFDVNKGDFGVRIRQGHARGSVLLPNAVVDLQSGQGKDRATATPVVVVEVLSPSTYLVHPLDKLRLYARLPSLVHYAVFSQDGPEVHLWRKGGGGWPSRPTLSRGLAAAVAFPEIGATVDLAEVYAGPGSRRVSDPGR